MFTNIRKEEQGELLILMEQLEKFLVDIQNINNDQLLDRFFEMLEDTKYYCNLEDIDFTNNLLFDLLNTCDTLTYVPRKSFINLIERYPLYHNLATNVFYDKENRVLGISRKIVDDNNTRIVKLSFLNNHILFTAYTLDNPNNPIKGEMKLTDDLEQNLFIQNLFNLI